MISTAKSHLGAFFKKVTIILILDLETDLQEISPVSIHKSLITMSS